MNMSFFGIKRYVATKFFTVVFLSVLISACDGQAWNSPHPAKDLDKNILYSTFSGRPKHLDPAISYSSDESRFIDQIYDPPLQYHYLKRPYELVPNTLTAMPEVHYLNAQGEEVAADSNDLAFSDYYLTIKPGIQYQPHPAFAKNSENNPFYDFTSADQASAYSTLSDFEHTSSRELTTDDYLYQIKRLADPSLLSPIRGLLTEYIVGMSDFSAAVSEARQTLDEGQWLDLRKIPFTGIKALSKYQYRIRIKGKYPQFNYWLAMHFFAPLPVEVDRFYHMPGMADRNLVLDWYPVGTGPYMMTQNDPNEAIVLEKNPHYREDHYPLDGQPGDDEAGLLNDAGKLLPFVDKVVYTLEKEAIPMWSKFLQGYYDRSGISSDSFDQAVRVGSEGIRLSDEMRERGITLERAVSPSTSYFGFNMLDDTIGDTGSDEERIRKRKLRQAIAIAYDQEEFISIFWNGRGEVGMSPIPPGIFGNQSGKDGINPYVYDWVDGQPKRKSIDVAKKLLAEAGYPEGRNATTGKPLILNFDTVGSTGSAQGWMIKQFHKLGIQINFRSTDYNRFQEKMRSGKSQMFQWGWLADYPDAENFLFLLYGPNGGVATNGAGVNSSNYDNPQYNALFERMKLMENTPERLAIIREMVDILHRDTPWAAISHSHDYVLDNAWVYNTKLHGITKAVLKYLRIDPQLRSELQSQRNHPVLWPVFAIIVAMLILVTPGYLAYRRRQQYRVKPRGEQ